MARPAYEEPDVHVFSSFDEAEEFIDVLEVENGVRYIRQQSRNVRETELLTLKKRTVFFKDRIKCGLEAENNGIPFVILRTDLRECSYGPLRHRHKKKLNSDNVPAETTPNLKKDSCRAKIIIRTLIRFPDYKLPGVDTKHARSKQTAKLKEEFGEKTTKKLEVVVNIVGTHSDHPTGQEGDNKTNIDRNVSRFIQDLVDEGVHNVDEMVGRVEQYVPTISDTRKTNRRFYPQRKTIYNIMYRKIHSTRFMESNAMESEEEPKSYADLVQSFLENKPEGFVTHCLQRLPPNTPVLEPDDIVFQSPEICTVRSRVESGQFYVVTFVDMMPFCACADFQAHYLPCTHILGVILECPAYGWDSLNKKYTEQACFNSETDSIEMAVGNIPTPDKQPGEAVSSGAGDIIEYVNTNTDMVTEGSNENFAQNTMNTEKTSVTTERESCFQIMSDIQKTIFSVEDFEALNCAKSHLKILKSYLESNIPRQRRLPVCKSKTVNRKRKMTKAIPQVKILKKKSNNTDQNNLIVDGTFFMMP